MKCLSVRLLTSALCAVLCAGSYAWAAPVPAPIVLTGADRRPATSLDGEWGSIVDPYFSGLFRVQHAWRWTGDPELEKLLRPSLDLHCEYI